MSSHDCSFVTRLSDSICCSSVFVIICHPAWFAASPLAWTFNDHCLPTSSTTRRILPMFSFHQFLIYCLSHLVLATFFDWTYKYVLARHLRYLPRVIPGIYLHATHRCITTQLYYTPSCNISFSMASPTCRILVHTLEKPFKSVWVDARCDAMSEICNPPLRGATSYTKCSTHLTYAVLDCLATAI
jgi:hypothetical protein